MDEVSIVLATYNGAQYIKEQLDSILQNTYTHWTLEVCDDGSTDETLAIVTEYQKQYPEKIFLHQNQTQLGVTKNFLQGVLRSKGQYVMYCDQDDVWLPEKIETTLKHLKQREQLHGKEMPLATFTDTCLVDEQLKQLHPSFFQYNALDTGKLDLAHLLMENKVIGCTTMFNQALAEKIKMLPEHARYHDWWIGLLAASMGELTFHNQSTMLYRQHGENVVGAQSFAQYVIKRMKNRRLQKDTLLQNQIQAEEFLTIYEKELTQEKKKILQEFANLHKRNPVARRWSLIKYHFWKTGLIRNIGVFFSI